jgi:hypothetical protein
MNQCCAMLDEKNQCQTSATKRLWFDHHSDFTDFCDEHAKGLDGVVFSESLIAEAL